MTLLEWPRRRAEGLGEGILRLRERLCLCSRCGGLSETPTCPICADPGRDPVVLCLVAQWDAIMGKSGLTLRQIRASETEME